MTVSPELGTYIHEHFQPSGFIVNLLTYISSFSHDHAAADEIHTASDDARADFERFLNENGHPYTLKSSPDPSEFDFVLRFADETYDRYCYCFRMHDGHVTYHRLTRADFRELYGDIFDETRSK